MSNPAYTRVAAYHWYLGSAFWRERREFIWRANRCEVGSGERPRYITSLISASSRSYRAT
jgi:hypothetical protein